MNIGFSCIFANYMKDEKYGMSGHPSGTMGMTWENIL